MNITHERLVKKARAWVFRQCPVVISELASGRESPDVIGFGGGTTILVECKSSVHDFRSDHRKFFRSYPELGMGDKRWFLVPDNMVLPQAVPDGWGLLYLRGERIIEIRPSVVFPKDFREEQGILLSLIRRLGRTGEGTSIRLYSVQTKNRSVAIVEAPTLPLC